MLGGHYSIEHETIILLFHSSCLMNVQFATYSFQWFRLCNLTVNNKFQIGFREAAKFSCVWEQCPICTLRISYLRCGRRRGPPWWCGASLAGCGSGHCDYCAKPHRVHKRLGYIPTWEANKSPAVSVSCPACPAAWSFSSAAALLRVRCFPLRSQLKRESGEFKVSRTKTRDSVLVLRRLFFS